MKNIINLKSITTTCIAATLTILCTSCSHFTTNKPVTTEHHHRQAHIAMHNGDAKAADAMAKAHGSHKKAHIHMHQGKHHEAEEHAKKFLHK